MKGMQVVVMVIAWPALEDTADAGSNVGNVGSRGVDHGDHGGHEGHEGRDGLSIFWSPSGRAGLGGPQRVEQDPSGLRVHLWDPSGLWRLSDPSAAHQPTQQPK